MGSGPRTGLAEIRLPDLQPGSSIMPGKVNPVVPEAVCQVVAQVIGNDAAVAFGGSAGTSNSTSCCPLLLATCSNRFHFSRPSARTGRQVRGWYRSRCRALPLLAESSPSVGTSLNMHIGYDEAAKVIKASWAENKTLKQVVLERGLLVRKLPTASSTSWL